MKAYTARKADRGTHTIRVTLQDDEYVGHIAYETDGNCKGLSLLGGYFEEWGQDEIDAFVENDCEFVFEEDGEFYTFALKDEDGNVCVCEADDRDIGDFVVAVEIVAFEAQG